MDGLLIFATSMVTLAAIYGMVCMALNLEAGVGPLWDLGIVGCFGVGGYAYVLLTADPAADYQSYLFGFGLPMWVGAIGAATAAGLAAWLISLPTLRLRKEYFLIVTLAFAEVIRQFYANEEWLTNGVAGIYGLDQPLKQQFAPGDYPYVLMALCLAGLAATWALTRQLSKSPFGRSIKALRENEALAITAGIEPTATSRRLYVTAGAITGFAGMFFVWYNTLIVPGQFDSDFTFFIWAALIIGGIGSQRGALVGAFVFILLHDSLRFVQVSGEMAVALTSLRTALVGLVLILILRFRPDGLFPERPDRMTKGSRHA
ncbi:branched-chain amino acid ABC transporter permease [Roseisalinus antarcticus]|uniref:Leucine/isoleucine/valine transporter permease subunit n=1 Tax=Roseisalinus antarcticus TaxID=254357 RepID=A0A1Y5TSD4_9RHOB|nr:branched-chain amino acid ABC transporter permease [Roseisalinus antarcticus]SLN70797.1 leucine/isoleucine/valine transporter permease subunit [Roseisalinus antarcticus]